MQNYDGCFVLIRLTPQWPADIFLFFMFFLFFEVIDQAQYSYEIARDTQKLYGITSKNYYKVHLI